MSKDNLEIYRRFCQSEPNLPLFLQDWWLDAVSRASQSEWNAAIKIINGRIAGVLPYTIKNRAILPPHLTPRQGCYIIYPDGLKYQARGHHEVEVMEALIDQLPDFTYFAQSCFYDNLNWQPFYWRGFQATPRYSYIIESGTSEDDLEHGFHKNIRKCLRKAAGIVEIREIDDVEPVYNLVNAVFLRKKTQNKISLDFFRILDQACKSNNARKILAAYDKEGNLHAAEYLVYDNRYVYAVSGGSDPRFRSSQAVSLLHREAILFALRTGRSFDFEGTMLKEVEPQFRQFGARQQMYLHIWKDNRSLCQRSLNYLKRRIFG